MISLVQQSEMLCKMCKLLLKNLNITRQCAHSFVHFKYFADAKVFDEIAPQKKQNHLQL